MSALTELARGQECQIRIPGICNFDPATTVLAHYRMAGICGTGQKPPDECGAWACSACHDAIDRRAELWLGEEFVKRAHLEGVMRTLDKLSKMGYRMRKG